MRLLHFVGCTAFNSTFIIGYAFLSKEEIVDDIWAMNAFCECVVGYMLKLFITDREQALISAIQNKYPPGHICICTWHINKNVLMHCKKLFTSGAKLDLSIKMWNSFYYATAEEDYEYEVRTLCLKFSDHPAC
jgi:MULE transposase domain